MIKWQSKLQFDQKGNIQATNNNFRREKQGIKSATHNKFELNKIALTILKSRMINVVITIYIEVIRMGINTTNIKMGILYKQCLISCNPSNLYTYKQCLITEQRSNHVSLMNTKTQKHK